MDYFILFKGLNENLDSCTLVHYRSVVRPNSTPFAHSDAGLTHFTHSYAGLTHFAHSNVSLPHFVHSEDY